MRIRHSLAAVAVVAGLFGTTALPALAQVVVNENFDSGTGFGFNANGSIGGLTPDKFARLSASLTAPFVGAMSISFSTVLDATYTVSFDLRRNTVLGGAVTAFVDGGLEYASLATGSWVTHNFTFVGTGLSTTLAFVGAGVRLDNVMVQQQPVTPVPGPIAGAGLPLLLGLAGYAAWRRRRQAA